MHTKKRNRLDTIRMNNLVYVQFSARLMNKKKKSNKLETLLASDASNAQSWIAEGCDDEMENDMLPPKKVLEMLKLKLGSSKKMILHRMTWKMSWMKM